MAIDTLDPNTPGLDPDMAARATPKPIKGSPWVAQAGDSLTEYGLDTSSATVTQWTVGSANTFLRWKLRQRIYTEPSMITARGGTTTAHLLATQVPKIIASGAAVALIRSGANDVNQGVAVSLSAANVRSAISMLTVAGMSSVLVSVVPWSGWSSAQKQAAVDLNRQYWLMSLDPALNVRFVDINPDMLDYATGARLASYTAADGIHDNAMGAAAVGQGALYDVMDALLPPDADLPVSNSNDTFSTTTNPSGNIVSNGLLAGSAAVGAGTQVNNIPAGAASGNVPTGGWLAGFTGNDAANPLTVAFSKGTHPTISTLSTVVMTLGGSGGNVGAMLNQPITIPAGVAAGDKLYGEADISYTDLSNVRAVVLEIGLSGGYKAIDGAPGVMVSSAMLPATFSGLWRTPALSLPTSPSGLYVRVSVIPNNTGLAVAGVVTISRVALRKAGLGPVASV